MRLASWWYIGVFGGVALFWLVYLALVPALIGPEKPFPFFGHITNPGVFGDMFGALTALFSGIAFGGLIIAILLQRKDLQMQQYEIGLTREVLKEQKNQLAEQVFATTFGQLLRTYHDTVDQFAAPSLSSGIPLSGRDQLGEVELTLRRSIIRAPAPTRVNIAAAVEGVEVNYSLGHYYRTVSVILQHISEQAGADSPYVRLFKALLPDAELTLLYYKWIATPDEDTFKNVALAVNLFGEINPSTLADEIDIEAWQKAREAMEPRPYGRNQMDW